MGQIRYLVKYLNRNCPILALKFRISKVTALSLEAVSD